MQDGAARFLAEGGVEEADDAAFVLLRLGANAASTSATERMPAPSEATAFSSGVDAAASIISSRHAFACNRRHARSGHLFERRYEAVPVTTDEQLWSVVRYIAQNPVEAGMCPSPEEWPWSSHTSIVSDSAPPWLDMSRLFTYVAAANGGDPRSRRYLDLVKGVRPL